MNKAKRIKLKNLFSKKNLIWYYLPALVIVLILMPMMVRQLAFNDFVPFSPSSPGTWGNKPGGFFEIPTKFDELRTTFYYLGLWNGLAAQNLFLLFFAFIGYFSFREVLKSLDLHKWVIWWVPLLFVFNPNTFIYSSGIWMFYNLIPVLFLLVTRLLFNFDFYRAFLLAFLFGLLFSNFQISFWNYGWMYVATFGYVVASYFFRNKKDLGSYKKLFKNWIGIVIASSLGFLFNLNSIRSLGGYVSNVGSIDYLESFHGCYPAVFWNLSRLGANGCNLMASLDYIQDNWWNISGYILVLIILLALPLMYKKIGKYNSKQLLIYSAVWSYLIFHFVLLVLLRFKFLDQLIIDNNPIIVSLRNPVKILEPFAFYYIILFAVSLSTILNNIKDNKWKWIKNIRPRSKQLLVAIPVLVLLVIYNHPFFMKDWKYTSMNQNTYWVSFEGEGSFYLTDKNKELEDFSRENYKDNILLVPFDYSIDVKTRSLHNIFTDTSNIMTQGAGNPIADDIFKDVCNGNIDNIASYDLGIKYIILDKKPQTNFNHDYAPVEYGNSDCQVEFDQKYYIWGETSYFQKVLKDYEIVSESEDYTIYKINDNNHDEFEIISPDGTVLNSGSYSNINFINYPGSKFYYKQFYYPGWEIRLKKDQGFNNFDTIPLEQDGRFMSGLIPEDLSEYQSAYLSFKPNQEFSNWDLVSTISLYIALGLAFWLNSRNKKPQLTKSNKEEN